jgi:hypothetical protein
MKKLHVLYIALLTMLPLIWGCEEIASECGDEKSAFDDAYGSLFNNPADIYWGVSGGVRSYTRNFTFGNICTKSNPKVSFTLALASSNTSLSNPISVVAGTYTCLGVQAQHATMTPDASQIFYRSEPSEIGMNQCFSGQASATIYPYITVSINTLGSDHADSVYLVDNISILKVYVDYREPK